jgi:hypothetical protein
MDSSRRKMEQNGAELLANVEALKAQKRWPVDDRAPFFRLRAAAYLLGITPRELKKRIRHGEIRVTRLVGQGPGSSIYIRREQLGMGRFRADI